MSTLQQLSFARMYTLSQVKQSPEAEWDVQPEGFSNTIRWNIGHIYVVMENFISKALPGYEVVNAEWMPLFVPGSSPTKWETEAPSNEELWNALKEQEQRVTSALEGKLNEPLPEPVQIRDHKMETVDALVQFTVWHEGVHAGVISGLNRVVSK
ncbi:DinB family protein [Sporosarcina sp. FSL W7-1349]|uniref:DinB family protein n=1 Tax=Sporosarcina sp. FSL W7-1349 TaxID=2921561 RepID=UPI0030FBF2F4